MPQNTTFTSPHGEFRERPQLTIPGRLANGNYAAQKQTFTYTDSQSENSQKKTFLCFRGRS